MTKRRGQQAAPVLRRLADSDVAAVYMQIGAILRAFHETTFEAFGYVATGIVEPHPTNLAYMEHQFTEKLREFADLGGDPVIGRAVESAVEGSTDLLASCKRAVLCHDDLHEWNVLVLHRHGEWLVSGVVDVENAVAGDPLLDLARTDYYAVRGNPLKHRSLLAGYGALPEQAEETLTLYRLYHALEIWDWFASRGNTEPLTSIADDMNELAQAAR
jgi:hygromycin-B 7''-O-kinase